MLASRWQLGAERFYRQEKMNYIIMFVETDNGQLEVQKIPRDDGRGMSRLSSQSASSTIQNLSWAEERCKSERGM